MIVPFFAILLVFCHNEELFEEYYTEAEKIMKSMTIEQRIGQMFFPKFNESTKDEDITKTYPGGFVLFANDFENKKEEDIIETMKYIQKLSKKTINLPLGLAVDEEGGRVNRISKFHRKEGKFPSPQEVYNETGLEGVLKMDKEKRDFLRKFKININLAPVADISYNSSDYIFDRTLGKSPEETAEYIKADVRDYVKDNFSCCNKHFPGYGNNVDTHGNIAFDDRPYETFLNEDFKTFEAGIAEKVPMILISHNIVKCKDDKFPASLSNVWVTILRKELNFSGLILTDDLCMDAIKKYSGELSPAILAVNAGNDVLLTRQYYEHLKAVKEAVQNKTISEETINTACKRVIAWKLKYLKNEGSEEEQKGETSNASDQSDHTGLIIFLSVVGILIVGIIVFIISRKYCCRKQNNGEIDRLMDD